MIDFTNAIEELNNYKGSEKKKTMIYKNKKYLVKFPDPIYEKNSNIIFSNNAYSEYIGSNIFKLVGFKVQNTILGKYIYNGKEKIVCACEDFTDENNILYEFGSLALSTNPEKKIDTELKDIIDVIKEEKLINTQDTIKKFWQMFIVDALIGNPDRHNENWGFLFNKNTKEATFSPIYDCGSCLNPILEDEDLQKINDTELKNLAINCYSCLKQNGKKINFINYIKKMQNEDCNQAIKDIFAKINLESIFHFIDNTEHISQIRKDFYKNIIKVRYEIISSVYIKLVNK